MKINRFLDLNAIIPLPLVPQISDGQVIDAVPVMALANYIAAAVNANAQPSSSGPLLAQFQLLGATGTFISATSFSVPGNYTTALLPFAIPGIKLLTTNTAGSVYSYVANATFGGGITTVTVVNLFGVLDSGLSTVNIGVISPPNNSNGLPQKSILQVLWLHNTDVLVSGTGNGKIVCTNNGFLVAAVNYGTGGLFPIGTEFSTATGLFTPARSGYYQINQYMQINTTGVTFSGICGIGSLAAGILASPNNMDFCADLQANRSSAMNSYVDYFSGSGNTVNLGSVVTFSVGTPVFVAGTLSIVGPL